MEDFMTEQKTWWASYDPETFKYAGMRLSVDKPANATDVGIGDLINPIWNPTTNQWTGDKSSDQLDKLKAEAEMTDKADNEPVADLASVVADLQDTVNTSVSSLMIQVAQLQAKLDVTPEAPTDVAVDTTTDGSATITAK